MIKVIHAADLYRRPVLAASMYRDRTAQFHDRLGWDAVSVDDMGLEFDQYDELNPVYVIIEDEAGEHCASARLLPTTGKTMLNDHFSDLTGGVALSSPLIWEVTRLCASPRLDKNSRVARRAPAMLFWAGCDLALRSGVEFFVAVYFSHMQRVWSAAGFAPEVMGTQDTADGEISAGLWEITPEFRAMLARRAGLGEDAKVNYLPSAGSFPQGSKPTRASTFSAVSDLARAM